MSNQFARSELIIGKEALEKLKSAKVAILGLGGVGSYVAEGLARAGIGNFILVDDDTVSITNINRQIIATYKTIGMNKVDVMKERILDINPNANIKVFKELYMPNSESNILNNDLSYVVDAIDTVTAKIDLAVKCNNMNIPIISAMGTGNKLDPSKFEITDIYNTSVCPLAKVMRKELRKRRINKLKVLYSKEEPIIPDFDSNNKNGDTKRVPGSISFVPSVAGLMIAGEVVRSLIK